MESQYKIGIIERCMMLFRRAPIRLISQQLKRCREIGMPMNPVELETHSLMGGDIVDLVDGLVYAKDNQMKGEFEHVAVRQMICAKEGRGSVVGELREMVGSGIFDLEHEL